MPKVVFSFDHEDYLVPETIDTAKHLADTLTKHGFRGAFCTVGERARFIQRLGRRDAIESLRKHGINQHSNRHSWQPTIVQDLEERDWDEGVRQFLANEGRAADSLREIFGVTTLPAAVPPGWQDCAPQGFYGYRLLGFQMIAGSFLSERPGQLLWYCNLLHQRYNFSLDGALRRLPLKGVIEEFEALLDEEYIVCGVHPTILYNAEFVDAHNRNRLALGPTHWEKPEPRPYINYRQSLENFEAFVRHVKSLPNCESVTYADLIAANPNPCPDFLSREQVRRLALVVANRTRPAGVRLNGHLLTPAEVFGALNWAVANPGGKAVPVRRLFGPTHEPQVAVSPVEMDRSRIRHAALQVERGLGSFLPAALPYDYPVSLGGHLRALGEYLNGERNTLTVRPLPNEPVEQDHPALAGIGYEGRWIWPAGFEGERLVKLGRLQAWTLKAAR